MAYRGASAFVLLGAVTLSFLSFVATADCVIGGFDLSSVPQAQLVISQQYGSNPLTPYTWVLNFCQPVNSPPDGATPCSDKATGNPVSGYITEYSTTHCETTWNAVQSGQGSQDKLVIQLAQIAPANHVGWTATVTLNCGGSTNPALVPTGLVVVTGATNALNFAFEFATAAVCGSPAGTPTPQTPMPPGPPGPTPSPNTPIPGPSPPTPQPPGPVPGPAPEEEPACSGGCAFVIVVFVGGFLYVAITVAFYYFRQEKRGRDLLPHPEFWKEFASLVRDGVVFSVQKIRALICKSGPYAGDGYQQV